jgi:hypothetical protein
VTVPSSLDEAMHRPSLLNATDRIHPEWPFSVKSSWPVATAQIRIVWSWPDEASRWPSGLTARLSTRAVCPRNG